MVNKKRVAMVLTLPQIQKLKQIALDKGLSFSELIRRILDEFLKKRKLKGDRKNDNSDKF